MTQDTTTPNNAQQATPIRFIDLFAGVGGFHIAAEKMGGSCVFASEWDPHAQKVYAQNHGLMPAGDITQIAAEEIPAHDLLCGGFPCQAFSVSGKQLGFADTRGTLFFDIVRIAKHHKPKVLFLENVKNFEKHDNGNTLRVVVQALQDIGYSVHHKVLNAAEHGVAQERKRFYIVAFRHDLNITDFTFPEPKKHELCVQDVLLPESETDDCVVTRDDVTIDTAKIPNGPQNRIVRIGQVGKGGQGERIYHPYGRAITLSAYGGGAGAKTGLYWIEGRLRKLAPRECARLQGFPDSFLLSDSRQQSYKQFGNSVAVPVLTAILEQIAKTGAFSN